MEQRIPEKMLEYISFLFKVLIVILCLIPLRLKSQNTSASMTIVLELMQYASLKYKFQTWIIEHRILCHNGIILMAIKYRVFAGNLQI